jgi:hypothetical protein
MKLLTHQRHQRGDSKPREKTKEERKPGDMKSLHLHTLQRKYIEPA